MGSRNLQNNNSMQQGNQNVLGLTKGTNSVGFRPIGGMPQQGMGGINYLPPPGADPMSAAGSQNNQLADILNVGQNSSQNPNAMRPASRVSKNPNSRFTPNSNMRWKF